MVDGVASFHDVDGGSDNSACGRATAAAIVGIAGGGVALGRSMLVLCWLVGWMGGRGGGGIAAYPPWLMGVFWKITRAKHGRMLNFGRGAKNKKKHNGPQN